MIDAWIMFKMKTMRDYHDFFYKIDILSLAYIFVKFIDMFFDIELDPCHCFCNTGLSWDAMLKMAGTELELISDIDVYLFAENGVREGIAYIGKRYSKANKNTGNHMMIVNQVNVSCFWTQIIYIVGH